MGRIAIVIVKGRMGAIECTTLALEEECDDLVGVVGGS